MFKLRLLAGVVAALAAVGSLTVSASAAPKTGCPAGQDWDEMTVEGVAATIWPGLIDPSPWTDQADFRVSAIEPEDRNGDGSLCLKIMWGEDLNPNAKWYRVGIDVLGTPTEVFLARDNTANASND